MYFLSTRRPNRPAPRQPMLQPLLPSEVASAPQISSLRLSNSTEHVVYCVAPFTHAELMPTSSLWIANTAQPGSARKLTSGLHNDREPAFHPTSDEVFFLSDRYTAGGAAAIYSIRREADRSTEPRRISPAGVMSFAISPNGEYIAYITGDATFHEGTRPISGDWKGRLQVISPYENNKKPRTLVSIDAHVSSFSWSPDSTRLLYRIQQQSGREECTFQERTISLDGPYLASTDVDASTVVTNHIKEPLGQSVWSSSGDIFYVQNYNPGAAFSSSALWGIAPRSNTANSLSSSSPSSPYYPSRRIAYGEQCDVDLLFDLGADEIAVSIAQGLDTQIHVLSAVEAQSWRRFIAFTTFHDAFHHNQHYQNHLNHQHQHRNLPAADMKRRPSDSTYVLATVRSSSVRQEPPEVWVGFTRPGEHGTVDICLSTHHEAWLANRELPVTEVLTWRGPDGEELQGIMSYPYDHSNPRGGRLAMRLPTIVVPHDEMIGRETYALEFGWKNWRTILASHGFLVISPNYHGSSGRGHAFSSARDDKEHHLAWDDIDSMAAAVIAWSLADPNRIAVGGFDSGAGVSWLRAWSAYMQGNDRFKAVAVVVGNSGAGDLSEMTFSSSGISSQMQHPHCSESSDSDQQKPLLILDASRVSAPAGRPTHAEDVIWQVLEFFMTHLR